MATNLLKQEVPREQVQYLLGYSDARTTDLYNRDEKGSPATSSNESLSEP